MSAAQHSIKGKIIHCQNTMNKPLSTFERKMKNNKFKKTFEQGYKELLFSELMITIIENEFLILQITLKNGCA